MDIRHLAFLAGILATVLSMVAIALQSWSTSSDLDFGVWGVCARYGTKPTRCLSYYWSSSQDESFCEMDRQVSNSFLVAVKESFVDDTCGSIGQSTFAFSLIAAILSAVMSLLLLLGVFCCKKIKRRQLVRVASLLATLCFISKVIAIILWSVRSTEFRHKKASFGWSFYLSIIASVFFLLTAASAHRFADMEANKSENDGIAYTTPRTDIQNKPMTGVAIVLV